MPHIARTRIAAPTRTAALVAGIAGLTLTLTACGGGSGLDGEYFAEDGKLVIDGSSVTYRAFDCPDGPSVTRGDPIDPAVLEDEPSAMGELSDDGTQIRWASDDEHIENDSIGGTTAVTSEEWESGDIIRITGEDDQYEFTPGDEDEILQAYADQSCVTKS